MNAKAEAKSGEGAKASAKSDHSWEMDDDSSVESAPEAGEVGSATKAAPKAVVKVDPNAAPEEFALLGARRDVNVSAGTPARCRCLAVTVGPPNHKELTWTATLPKVNPATQLVVALTSENMPCDDSSAPGASYQGYRAEGGNVIISVEARHPGRPVTHGAIIPKPDPGGQVIIEGIGKVPYGRGASGEARCSLGSGT